jgi:hypothetical protein
MEGPSTAGSGRAVRRSRDEGTMGNGKKEGGRKRGEEGENHRGIILRARVKVDQS